MRSVSVWEAGKRAGTRTSGSEKGIAGAARVTAKTSGAAGGGEWALWNDSGRARDQRSSLCCSARTQTTRCASCATTTGPSSRRGCVRRGPPWTNPSARCTEPTFVKSEHFRIVISGGHLVALAYLWLIRSSCFFRVKAADDFRSLLETKSVALRRSRLKRVSRASASAAFTFSSA